MGDAARKLEALPRRDERGSLTLLDLVAAVAREAESDEEILAVVHELIRTGKVRLIGNFRGSDVKMP